MTCTDCDCKTGEQGAVDVKPRSVAGLVEPRCLECWLYAEDEAVADLADERAFYA